MKHFFKSNGLSIVFLLLFVLTLFGQTLTGMAEHNSQIQELGGQTLNLTSYLTSGHFLQATFENWESEFLQMALFVILTMFLYQKGSAESKDPDKEEEVEREPDPSRAGAPWAVRKGGFVLAIYKHSLFYALFFLFLVSFGLHLYGSAKDFNEEQIIKGKATISLLEYSGNSRFWFESFQNWESEFLSVFAIVVLSVFLREKGSAQSKPVDAPNSQTGEG